MADLLRRLPFPSCDGDVVVVVVVWEAHDGAAVAAYDDDPMLRLFLEEEGAYLSHQPKVVLDLASP